MKDHKKTPFENFEDLARTVVNVPRAIVKKQLDEEKRNKTKRNAAKKHASREAGGPT
jgi:hypothetical protein